MNIENFVSNSVELDSREDVPIFKIEGFDAYSFEERGVTEQFLDHADDYFERYTQPSHYKDLYRLALQSAKIDPHERRLRVLDIGTGGGNSVFAIQQLLGQAEILGTDISRPLLKLCARMASARYGLGDRDLTLLCADLYDLKPVDGSVDLVTGSSILHHMVDPGPIAEMMLRALRPGGHAIFTEPFEDGHGILRAIYATILEGEPTYGPVPGDIRQYLVDYIADFDARRGIGEVRDYTAHLDDKWFFTKFWFADLARRCSCDGVTILPTHAGAGIFWSQFEAAARLHNGSDASALPPWARRFFEIYDGTFSSKQLAETCFTGVVVVRR